MVAGAGFGPASSGYEPDKEPLLYPAKYSSYFIFKMVRVVGFEPTAWQSQSLLPYLLATPYYKQSRFNINFVIKLFELFAVSRFLKEQGENTILYKSLILLKIAEARLKLVGMERFELPATMSQA